MDGERGVERMTLIGVAPSGIVEQTRLQVNQTYVEGVYRAGALPVLFPLTADPERLRSLMNQVDGLLLPGGDDVEPSLYGEEKLPCCGECTPERDALEYPLCRLAIELRKPVLAICRGIQMLNCALGGTLYQDLETQFGTALRHPCFDAPARDPAHEVTVRPDTLLASIVGSGTLGVNSRHHQGIKTMGPGVIVSAQAPDGLIEAIEYPECPFVLGVQWHPEAMAAYHPVQQRLFDAFVRACEKGKTDA